MRGLGPAITGSTCDSSCLYSHPQPELLQAPAPTEQPAVQQPYRAPRPTGQSLGSPLWDTLPVLRTAPGPAPHGSPLSALSYHWSPRPSGCTLGPDFTCHLASLRGQVTLLPPSSLPQADPLRHVLHCFLQSLCSSLIPEPSLAPMSEDPSVGSGQPARSSWGRWPPPSPCSPGVLPGRRHEKHTHQPCVDYIRDWMSSVLSISFRAARWK